MTNEPGRDNRSHVSIVELTEDQLKQASGGQIVVQHTVTAPRDAASGLATGRRSHLVLL